MRQYLSQKSVLHLYGWTTARLPDWFTERFPAEYRHRRLFDEPSAEPPYAGVLENRRSASRVSTPERAPKSVVAGNLRIVPCKALQEDHAAMIGDGMILGESLAFDQRMLACSDIQERVNQAAQP